MRKTHKSHARAYSLLLTALFFILPLVDVSAHQIVPAKDIIFVDAGAFADFILRK